MERVKVLPKHELYRGRPQPAMSPHTIYKIVREGEVLKNRKNQQNTITNLLSNLKLYIFRKTKFDERKKLFWEQKNEVAKMDRAKRN